MNFYPNAYEICLFTANRLVGGHAHVLPLISNLIFLNHNRNWFSTYQWIDNTSMFVTSNFSTFPLVLAILGVGWLVSLTFNTHEVSRYFYIFVYTICLSVRASARHVMFQVKWQHVNPPQIGTPPKFYFILYLFCVAACLIRLCSCEVLCSLRDWSKFLSSWADLGV